MRRFVLAPALKHSAGSDHAGRDQAQLTLTTATVQQQLDDQTRMTCFRDDDAEPQARAAAEKERTDWLIQHGQKPAPNPTQDVTRVTCQFCGGYGFYMFAASPKQKDAVRTPCPACGGDGFRMVAPLPRNAMRCDMCGGIGRIVFDAKTGTPARFSGRAGLSSVHLSASACPKCSGTGYIVNKAQSP